MATSNFGSSGAAPPAGAFSIGEAVVIDTDFLNIRENPSLKALTTATLRYMSHAFITDGPTPANGYNWYRIETNASSGWSAEQYLSREDEVGPATHFVVGDAIQVDDPEGLRLRTAPPTASTQISSLTPGVRGVVVDGPKAADRYVWRQIQTDAGTGWCAEEFLSEAPLTTPPPAKFAAGDQVVVDTDSLNLRESAGATEPIITALGNGVPAEIIDGPELANNMSWYKLETGHGSGWSIDTFLTLTSASSPDRQFTIGSQVYVSTDALNLRTSPGTAGEVVAVLYTNAGGKILDGPVEKNGYIWYQIESNAGTGWSAAQYLAKNSADPGATSISNGDTVFVDTDILNVRASASLSAQVVSALATDESAIVIGLPVDADGFTWRNLSTDRGTGWSVATYLAKVPGKYPRKGDTARVFDGELNQRAAASTGSDVIAVLPDAVYVNVLEGPVGGEDDDWFRVSTSKFGAGWCAGTWLYVV